MQVPDQEECRGLRGDALVIFQSILLPVTFIITYIIATSMDHVEKEFPYISDTGTWPPESCIFGILLCFYSLTTFITVHIRWRVLHMYATCYPRLNNVAFGVGLVASFGVLLVANFQETSQLVVHIIGALMAFFVGAVYMWLQTWLTWKTPEVPGFLRQVTIVRLLLSVFSTISAILIMPFAMAANNEYLGNDTKSGTRPGSGKWDAELGGFEFHVTSTSFEWALAGLVCLYFLSFAKEFRYVRFGMPRLHMGPPAIDIDGKSDLRGQSNQGVTLDE